MKIIKIYLRNLKYKMKKLIKKKKSLDLFYRFKNCSKLQKVGVKLSETMNTIISFISKYDS